ncbi:MAG: hypothetical protein U0573_04515 [Phycisphaerales bacterium]|nr:hypothetical protein [Planctomycetota bacterium]
MNVVEDYFVRRGIAVTISREGTVTPTGSESVYGLQNLLQNCAWADARDLSEMRGRVADHFDTMTRAQDQNRKFTEQLESWEFAKPRLRVRLWDVEVGSFLTNSVTRSDIPGLATTLSVDLPESIDSVSPERAAKWHRTDSELFEIALENTMKSFAAEATTIDSSRFGPAQVVQADSFYSAGAALELEKYPALLGPHGAFVTIPTRAQVFALPLETAGDLAFVGEFIRFACWCFQQGPGSVSKRLWWYRDGRWFEIAYKVEGTHTAIMPPEELQKYMMEVGWAQ